MIKAVIIGFAHMHVNEVAEYISSQKDMELLAAADLKADVEEITQTRYTRAWNMKNVQDRFGTKIYDDYLLMLDTEKPDIAFILTETVKKAQAVAECAKRHINVSIEKPIGMSLQQAEKIKKSVEENHIEAIVNWPLTWRPYLHKMKVALDSGLIGELIKIRFLIGNTGPVGRGAMHRGVTEKVEETTDFQKSKMWWYQKKQGGGVLLDFCCYGCMLSHWFTGEKPQSVLCTAGNFATGFSDVYDNAVAILNFPKSLSAIESTWTTPSRAIPAGPMLFGTEGVLYAENIDGNIVVKAFDIYGTDMPVADISLPSHFKNIAEHYAHHKMTGEPVHSTLEFYENLYIMTTLDAAVRSAELHTEVIL